MLKLCGEDLHQTFRMIFYVQFEWCGKFHMPHPVTSLLLAPSMITFLFLVPTAHYAFLVPAQKLLPSQPTPPHPSNCNLSPRFISCILPSYTLTRWLRIISVIALSASTYLAGFPACSPSFSQDLACAWKSSSSVMWDEWMLRFRSRM